MSIHLFVIARHNPVQSEFEFAANAAVATDEFIVERCESPQEFLPTVRRVALQARKKIRLLDIYGHARRGQQSLGSGLLFDETTGEDIAQGLRIFLTPTATVRLLGCDTAVGQQGKRLIETVRRNLGESRCVQGTIASFSSRFSFGPNGFAANLEDPLLFSSSSTQPIAPTQVDRQRELRDWYVNIGGN